MKETFKTFVDEKHQEELRVRLFKILKKNPQPIADVAKKMDIGRATLFRFLKEELQVDFVRLTKIETWIKKHE